MKTSRSSITYVRRERTVPLYHNTYLNFTLPLLLLLSSDPKKNRRSPRCLLSYVYSIENRVSECLHLTSYYKNRNIIRFSSFFPVYNDFTTWYSGYITNIIFIAINKSKNNRPTTPSKLPADPRVTTLITQSTIHALRYEIQPLPILIITSLLCFSERRTLT